MSPSMDEPTSSPPTHLTPPEDALTYYKSQYEQLEHELAEFQASSQELEAELEKDVDAAEKRERVLQEKAESLGFEVEEWKTKYKQAKTEAGAAQNTLQKEITTLRDTNRTLQLKLRDIEVTNDDFERQARNTSSSLEDLESKFNQAIERAVMMEEEIRIGEQEREGLRVETQRLRDELSDLKIEAEITHEKLRKQNTRKLPILSTDITAPNSPFENSPDSVASSPLITTPPDTKSVGTIETVSETPTPPSPPISETSIKTAPKPILKTPINQSKIRMPSGDSSTTPKPSRLVSASRPPRKPAVPTNSTRATPSVIRNATNKSGPTRGLPSSTSLTHIRTLTAQMQRLEQRVHSARSKLPAPVSTPPRSSPRNSASHTYIPPSVTIRSRKRTTGSTVSNTSDNDNTPSLPGSTKHVSRLSTSGISRLSFGPLPVRDGDSRPSSRASNTFARPDRPASRTEVARPLSRASMSGARTPLGHYSQSSLAESRRPRSSIGGSFSASQGHGGGHGHSQSVSGIHIEQDELRDLDFSTPSRRGTLGKVNDTDGGSAIPAPSGLPRRQSGGFGLSGRRTSSGTHNLAEKKEVGSMKPPAGRQRKLSGVGETF